MTGDLHEAEPPRELEADAAAPARFTRRRLLRLAGVSAGSVVVIGGAGAGYRAYSAGAFAVGDGPAYRPWQTWDTDRTVRGLIGAAILAPSPHDAQAWRFVVGPDRIDVHADRTRLVAVSDPYGRELAAGVGAAIENLMLAAAARGHAPRLSTTAGAAAGAVATIELATAAARPSDQYAAIPHRHSNRYAFSDRPLPAATLDPARRLAADLGPAQLVLITDRAGVRRVGELVVSATGSMVADRERSAEDYAWTRQDWGEIQRRRDGITLDAAGLSDWLVRLAKMLPAQSATSNDNAWLEGTRDRQVRTAMAWGIVAVPDVDDPQQQLVGGRLLQRTHLWATVNGLALQHMNAITERADRERQLGLTDRLRPALAALLPERGLSPLVVFRLGYPTRPGRPSPRRAVSWVTT